MCDGILSESKNIVILGDLNYNDLHTSHFRELYESFGLKNIIKKPTCRKEWSQSLVDVILVTQHRSFFKPINSPCWLSDFHHIICVSTRMALPKRPKQEIIYRSFKHFNADNFVMDLFVAFESCVFYDVNVNVCVRYVIDSIQDIVNKHAPFKSKFLQHNNVPHMNQEWRKACHNRNMYRNVKDKFPSEHTFETYRQHRNKCTKLAKKI